MENNKIFQYCSKINDFIESPDKIITSPKEKVVIIKQLLQNTFDDVELIGGITQPLNFMCDDVKVNVYHKNITHLGATGSGKEDRRLKKRIQFGFADRSKVGINTQKEFTIILGYYAYNEEVIFTMWDFPKPRFGKNTSCHVNCHDLKSAFEYGVISKIDARLNQVISFRGHNLTSALKYIRRKVNPNKGDIMYQLRDELATEILKRKSIDYLEAISEMKNGGSRNVKQNQWQGWWFEWFSQNYIKTHQKFNDKMNVPGKTVGSTQWDAELIDEYQFDFKTTSINSMGNKKESIGNDYDSVVKTINQYNSLWYVVLLGNSIKEDGTETTEQYYMVRGKVWADQEIKRKMCKTFIPTEVALIEIDDDNFDQLTIFNQGKNSNGKARPPKVNIPHHLKK